MFGAVAILLGGILFRKVGLSRVDRNRVYKVGFGGARPLHFEDEQGNPSGLAVGMIKEAARRRGIKLAWVNLGTLGLDAIRTGQADLWALITDLPERRKLAYISEPFLVTEYCFLVRSDSGYRKTEDLANARITSPGFGIHHIKLAQLLPDAKLDDAKSAGSALAKLDSHEQDAVFLEQYAAGDLVLSTSFAGTLRIIPAPTPRSYLGLASDYRLAAVADEIRDEMRTMSADGTLEPLISGWGFFPSLNLEAIDGLSTAKRRERFLISGILALFTLLIFTLVLIASLKKQRNKLAAVESALRESSNYHRTLIELLPDTVYVVSQDATRGYSARSYRDDTAVNWIVENPVHQERIREVISTGITGVGEERTPEGRCLEYHLVPLRDASGKITAAMGVLQDKTEKYRADEERQRLEEKLRQAQKMEGVGRLAGGVAHDFNNLLTIIIGYSSMLLADSPAESSRNHNLKQVISAGNRAAALTQQLLAFSRKQVIQPKLADLNQIVIESTNMLGRLLGSDVVLKTSLTPGLPSVMVDRGQIDQILMNLAANARDAMPDGGFFTLTTSQETWTDTDAIELGEGRPKECILLTVSDSGLGMDSATTERIFEPFFTTKEAGQGTGLGLSTVYGIVRQSGGWISVASRENLGTTFSIYLPVPAQAVRAEEFANRLPDSETEDRISRGGTILIVEDQEDIRVLEAEVLRLAGYRVLEAGSPEDALLECQRFEGHIDMLLTDIVMPGMRGPELARRIRLQRPDIKLLFASGYAGELQAGRDQLILESTLLAKPFGKDVLVNAVRQCLAVNAGSLANL